LIYKKATFYNPTGICHVTEKPFTIATLGSKEGEVCVWNPENNKYTSIIAHDSSITVVKLSNHKKQMIATASLNSTNIHVYCADTGDKLSEYRRGVNIVSKTSIYDIAFSHNNLLACCSSNGTIHIFDIKDTIDKNSKDISNEISVLSFAKDYLPKYFSSQWAKYKNYIGTKCKMICQFDKDNSLHIAAYDGQYYRVSGKSYNLIRGNKLCV
jgi:WD40 repeat protein